MSSITSFIPDDIFSNFFYRALLILIRKPQVINRKLSCSVNKLFIKINKSKDEFLKKIQIDEIKKLNENFKSELIKREITFEDQQLDILEHIGDDDEEKDVIFVSLDKCLPRNANKFNSAYVLTIIGKEYLIFNKLLHLQIFFFFRKFKSINIFN